MNIQSAYLGRRIVIITAILMYASALFFAYQRLSHPSDGTRLWLVAQQTTPGSISTVPLNPERSLLREGDRVIAVNGRSMTDWVDSLFQFNVEKPAWQFGQQVTFRVMRNQQALDVPLTLENYPLGTILKANLLTVVFLALTQIASGWLLVQRPDERTSQTLFVATVSLTTFSICWFMGTDVASLVNAGAIWVFYRVLTFILIMVMCASLLHFTLLLPRLKDERPLPSALVWGLYLAPYPLYTGFLMVFYTSNTLEWLRSWEHGIWLLIFSCFITGLIAAAIRYRHIADHLARKRLLVVVLAIFTTGLLAILIGWLPVWMARGTGTEWQILPLVTVPIVIGLIITVVFYRLFDIRIVIQRTLVWSALTAMIVGIYIAIVGTLSLVFNQQYDPILSLLATGVSAVLFQPVRHRLQHAVNRFIYGERVSPYDVIVSLTKRLEEAIDPQIALNMIVETIGKALKLPYTAIELMENEHSVIAAEYGLQENQSDNERLYFPLKYEKGTIGRLIVAPPFAGATLTLQDHKLISGLIHVAEVAIQTAHLTVDLQRSREKLVLAQAEERRRIRRDLHDGLGPILASLMLQVDAARNLMKHDQPKAEALLLDLKKQIQTAIADVRRLVYELQPPILEELGLIAALEEKARQIGQSSELLVTVSAAPLPPLSAAVESALYRIALEALANTIRHGQASKCSIRLTLNGDLRLEVTDNGRGLPTNLRYGIGIKSMLNRAEELGGTCTVENVPEGGLQVVAKLPLRTLPIPAPQTKG
jgi:signal transduction histidine kinase